MWGSEDNEAHYTSVRTVKIHSTDGPSTGVRRQSTAMHTHGQLKSVLSGTIIIYHIHNITYAGKVS